MCNRLLNVDTVKIKDLSIHDSFIGKYLVKWVAFLVNSLHEVELPVPFLAVFFSGFF